ncbi:MAG: type transport system ATP-binding protein [Micromonosporaceae bacterium]|nr:type transport system ATP-binding protein [Micromonosporaceae bacterium]
MPRTSRHSIVPILIAGGGLLAAAAPPAAAAVPTATTAAATAAAALTANCAPYPGGTTICSAQPPSFDGSPMDVDVTMPMPGTGSQHPLIVLLHGFGNNKHEWESTSDAGDDGDKYHWNSHWFAEHGYYVLTYTSRGFKDNGTTGSYQPATPAGTAASCLPPGGSACLPAGTIRVKNMDVEIRDTQWLAALTALAFPDLDRDRVAVSGGSYGGGESWLQAADQAARPHWADFPGLPQLHLQVAVPKYPWTDLAYSLAPNGHPGGPAQDPAGQPYRGSDLYSSAQGAPDSLGVGNPFGVSKLSYIAGLYSLGTTNGVFDEGYPAPQTNGPEPFSAWLGRVNAGEPYDAPGRVDDPVVSAIRTSFSGWHSAYYHPGWRLGQAAGREPAVFSISGWTDDLFPPVESFRMFNYLKDLDPQWPVAVAVGDVGHSRAQNPGTVWTAINAQAWAFLRDNIAGSHPQRTVVSSFPTVCGGGAGFAEEISAASPAGLARGQLTLDFNGSAVLSPTSGTGDPNGAATDAPLGGSITNSSNCRTSPAAPADGYTATSQPLPSQQTVVGIGYAEAQYAALTPSGTAVLAERVWDVKPDGVAVLISRGVYRFDFHGYDATTGTVRVPLYGNHWAVPQGDRIRLDLAQVDQPTYRPPNAAFTSTLGLSGIRLILPVREDTRTTTS